MAYISVSGQPGSTKLCWSNKLPNPSTYNSKFLTCIVYGLCWLWVCPLFQCPSSRSNFSLGYYCVCSRGKAVKGEPCDDSYLCLEGLCSTCAPISLTKESHMNKPEVNGVEENYHRAEAPNGWNNLPQWASLVIWKLYTAFRVHFPRKRNHFRV